MALPTRPLLAVAALMGTAAAQGSADCGSALAVQLFIPLVVYFFTTLAVGGLTAAYYCTRGLTAGGGATAAPTLICGPSAQA